MDGRPDPLHARRLLGLRFVDRDTEIEYRRWRDSNATTFARIGYIGSTPSWILLMAAAFALHPDAAREAAVWVIGWIVLLLVVHFPIRVFTPRDEASLSA